MAITLDEIWDYYQDNYGGSLPEEAFRQLGVSVQMRLQELIFGREVPEEMEQRYMQAFCELVDFRNETKTAALAGGIVESENIDGYSVRYRDRAFEMEEANEIRIAEKYLTYPKNLMYCGTERKWKLTII